MRRAIICADDFGFSAAACRSILLLGEATRISATSVAVDGGAAREHCGALAALRPRLSVGLHLNLTENPNFAGARPLWRWIVDTHGATRLSADMLRTEVHRQLDRFEALLGAPPDYVDGHEHVHQFPGIREPVLDALAVRYGRGVAARSTWPRRFRGAKAAIIGALGGKVFMRRLDALRIGRNSDFAGVYDLRQETGFGLRMRSWLDGLADGGLVMCHPEQGPGASAARSHEHDWFASSEWTDLLAASGTQLAPFRAPSGAH